MSTEQRATGMDLTALGADYVDVESDPEPRSGSTPTQSQQAELTDFEQAEGGGSTGNNGGKTGIESEPTDSSQKDWLTRLLVELDTPWRDRLVLEELYWRRGFTQYEIADHLGCSRPTVGYWMREHDVTARHDYPGCIHDPTKD